MTAVLCCEPLRAQAPQGTGQGTSAGATEPAAPAQGTLPYTTTILPTGNSDLDAPLRDASRLRSLAERAPVDAFGLVARALAEPRRLEEVLRAEGYWAGLVEVTIAGEPAATPGLEDRLTAARPASVPVEIRVTPGTRYTLRNIAVRPALPEVASVVTGIGEPPGIARGDPARAGPVLDVDAELVDRMRRTGYPLAAIADREVIVDHEQQTMDVAWTLAPGPRATFAPPEIDGDTAVNRALLARITNRLEGQLYAPATQERTRRELLALGVFENVRARAAQRLDEAGRLPVTFTVVDRPRNAAGASLAYETNYGPSASVYYERRNLWGNAERLRVELILSRLGADGGSGEEAAARANARLAANLRRPGLIDGRTTQVTEVAAVRDRLDAYDRDAFIATVLLERPIGERWVVSAGPTFETGRIGRDEDLNPFTLAGFVLGGRFDSTNSPLDPRRGIRASLTVTPYADLAGESGSFVRSIGTLRGYQDLSGTGSSVLALRGTLGSLLGAEETASGGTSIPLDKRFYSGGGGSVRGYRYQGIGPRDRRNRPDGGSSLVEGSVELRQRIRGNIGMVAFVDAGAVGPSTTPEFGEMRYGVGLGARYATAIGPLRIDLAVPLQKQRGDDGYGVYVGLGQAF